MLIISYSVIQTSGVTLSLLHQSYSSRQYDLMWYGVVVIGRYYVRRVFLLAIALEQYFFISRPNTYQHEH